MGFGSGFGGTGKPSDRVALGNSKTIPFNDGGMLKSSSDFIFDKDKKSLIVTNLSGSLTALSDGSPYLRAGANISLTTGSGGWVTISSTGGGEADHDKLKKLSWVDSGHTSPALSLPVFDSEGKPAKVNAPASGERTNKVLSWISDTTVGWVSIGSGVVLIFMLDSDPIVDASQYNADSLVNRGNTTSWEVSADPVFDKKDIATAQISIGGTSGAYTIIQDDKHVFVNASGLYGSLANNFNINTDLVDPTTNLSTTPLDTGGLLDSDGDGIPDINEDVNQNNVQDPGETDPFSADSDSDGLSDGAESTIGTDPLNPDSDGDGVADGSDTNPTDGTIT